jgi:uncharacterized membrane protein YkgB
MPISKVKTIVSCMKDYAIYLINVRVFIIIIIINMARFIKLAANGMHVAALE